MAAFLVHHNIMLGLALRRWIHCGKADEIIFLCIEFNWRLLHLGWNASELRLALRVGINTHIELVSAKRSIRQVNVDSRSIHRLLPSESVTVNSMEQGPEVPSVTGTSSGC